MDVVDGGINQADVDQVLIETAAALPKAARPRRRWVGDLPSIAAIADSSSERKLENSA